MIHWSNYMGLKAKRVDNFQKESFWKFRNRFEIDSVLTNFALLKWLALLACNHFGSHSWSQTDFLKFLSKFIWFQRAVKTPLVGYSLVIRLDWSLITIFTGNSIFVSQITETLLVVISFIDSLICGSKFIEEFYSVVIAINFCQESYWPLKGTESYFIVTKYEEIVSISSFIIRLLKSTSVNKSMTRVWRRASMSEPSFSLRLHFWNRKSARKFHPKRIDPVAPV